MKKRYYIKPETTKEQLEKLGFNVITGYGFAVNHSDVDQEFELYINLGGSTSYELHRIYHNSNDTMVKASEIRRLIEAGIVR